MEFKDYSKEDRAKIIRDFSKKPNGETLFWTALFSVMFISALLYARWILNN